MGTYTSAELVTIVASLGVLITGVGAVIVNIIVALRTGHKVDVQGAKTDGLVAQVREVHTLTNSNLSAVKAELAISNALNAELRTLIVDLKGERGKLAALTAAKLSADTPLPVTIADAPVPVTVVDRREKEGS